MLEQKEKLLILDHSYPVEGGWTLPALVVTLANLADQVTLELTISLDLQGRNSCSS